METWLPRDALLYVSIASLVAVAIIIAIAKWLDAKGGDTDGG